MFLLWVALAFLGGAVAVGLRWVVARPDSLGRKRPFPIYAVGLLVLASCVALTPWVMRTRLEHRLSEAATRLAGVRVAVHCQTFGSALADVGAELGYVKFGLDGTPERSTLIKRNQCRDISSYLRSDKSAPDTKQVVAVHTLTHEVFHMKGITNESVTECLAIQHDAEMARLLGASADGAQRLAVAYWRDVYPRMPANYRSDQCGPGLSLDTAGPDAPWVLTDSLG